MTAERSLSELRALEERWLAAALSTAPPDRPAAERAVMDFYRRVGWIEAPREFVWCVSPADFAAAIARYRVPPLAPREEGPPTESISSRSMRLIDRVISLYADRPHDLEWGNLGRYAHSSDRDRLGRFDVPGVRGGIPAYTRSGLRSIFLAGLGSSRREWSQIYTQFECGDLDALYGSERGFSAARRAGDPAARDALVGVMRHAGAFLPLWGSALLCGRPSAFELNERGEAHGAHGPALIYPDGWRGYAWMGRPIDERLWRRLSGDSPLTPLEVYGIEDSLLRGKLAERIGLETYARGIGADRIRTAEISADERDRLIEAYGLARFVLDSPHHIRDSDEFGELLCLDLDDRERPLVILEVDNATPEPDGGSRKYHLRVPPDMWSPREAVAWTFDVDAADYDPEVQT